MATFGDSGLLTQASPETIRAAQLADGLNPDPAPDVSTQPVGKAKPLPMAPPTDAVGSIPNTPPLTLAGGSSSTQPAAPATPVPTSQSDPMAFAPTDASGSIPTNTATLSAPTSAPWGAGTADAPAAGSGGPPQAPDQGAPTVNGLPTAPAAAAPTTYTTAQLAAMTPEQRKAAEDAIYHRYDGVGTDIGGGSMVYNNEYAMSPADLKAYQYLQSLNTAAANNPAELAALTDPGYTSTMNTGQDVSGNAGLMAELAAGKAAAPPNPVYDPGGPSSGTATPVPPQTVNGLPTTTDGGGSIPANLPQFTLPTNSEPTATDAGGSIAANLPTLQLGANGLPATPSSTASTAPTVTPSAPSAPASPTVNGLSASAATGGNSGAGYNLTPTTPSTALSNSTITPGPGVDRFKIAQDEYNAAKAASEPGYQADLTLADRMAAGAGTIGSGQLNTSLGNIANTRQSTLAKQQSDFLNQALTGTIADQYQNIGIAQQQQGVQIGQQNTAFNQQMSVQQLMDSEQGQQWTMQMQALGFNAQQIQQAFENQVQTQQLSDSENNQSFNQAMQKLLVGSAGDPSGIELIMMQVYGMDAEAAAKAAANYYQTGQLPQPKPTTTTTGSGATGSQGQPTE